MNITSYTSRNAFGTNGYIVTSDKGNSVLIDAPQISDKKLAEFDGNNIKITKILLTHGHCDHIDSLVTLAEKYDAEVYIHEADAKKLRDDFLNLSEYFRDYYTSPVTHFYNAKTVKDGDIIRQDELTFRVFHTPGHTSGSVCYIIGNTVFSGDTLFSGSIGRTDMPDGDSAVIMKSLERLGELDNGEDTVVLPGHGNPTTLSFEKKFNPYLKGASYDDML